MSNISLQNRRLLFSCIIFFIASFFAGPIGSAGAKAFQDKSEANYETSLVLNNLYRNDDQIRITLNLHEVSLPVALLKLAQKADVGISFDRELLPDKQITYRCINEKIFTALEVLLRGTNLTYTISKDREIIIILKKYTLQTGSITGVVTNAETGKPLPGASVFIERMGIGAATEEEGEYTITGVEPGTYILIARFIGYKEEKKEITVVANETITVNFGLVPKASELGELVVTGYREIEKRKLTSAVAKVNPEDIATETAFTVDKMLQGRVPGLSVIESSGAVGAVPIVKIRGTATLTGSAQPLWVIDGVIQENPVPLSPSEINSPNIVNRIGNAVSGLNPSDIESITILKDASATAIYGVKAANGVIVVTTKDGREGPIRVNYQTTTGITMSPSYGDYNMMNSKERIDVAKYYFNLNQQYYNADANIYSVGLAGAYARYKSRELDTWQDFQAAVRRAQTMNTNWFDVLFKNAASVYNNINVAGGSDKSTYYASFSALNQDGLNIMTNYDRYTGMVKFRTELTDFINANFYLSGYKRQRESYPRTFVPREVSNFIRPTPTPFSYALNTSRTFSPKRDDGSSYFYRPHNNFYLFNILNEYNNSNQVTKTNGYSARISLDVDISDKFRAFGLFNYSANNTHNETYYEGNTNLVAGIRRSNFGEPVPENSNLPRGGVIFSNSIFHNYYMTRLELEFRPISTNNHQVELFGGGEYRVNTYRIDRTTGWGYLHDRGKIISTSENIGEELSGAPYLLITDITRKYASYYGVASYTYDDTYTINLNARFDGSNLFGSNPKYRWKPAWSISGRWNIKNEAFMQGIDFVNLLALKASYGVQGSTNEQNTPQIVASFLQSGYWSELNQLEIRQPANPNLRWEKTYNTNIGIEFQLFDYRITGAVNVYNRKSEDLIINTRISEVNGFSFLPINFADVTNRGIEFGITINNIRQKNFTWSSSVNFSYNRNRVKNVNLAPNVTWMLISSTYKPRAAIEGRPINSLYSVKYGFIDDNGIAHFILANGDTTSVATGLQFEPTDLIYNGPIIAPYTGGINNRFTYKNFEFSFFFTYAFGNKIRMKEIMSDQMYSPDQNLSKELLNAWGLNGNEDTNVPTILNTIGSNTHKEFWNKSDIRVVNGGYIRLKNVSLRYNLPLKLLTNLGLTRAYVQIEGNNLLLFADDGLHGFDPETFNYKSLPNLTSFAMSLNVTF